MDQNEELENGTGTEESPEQKANKETKKYLRVIDIVKSIVGGEDRLRPKKKVKADDTATLVAELFAEEEVELKTKVKSGLKNLLKQHVELEAAINKKKQELEKEQLEKRKEFTKAANAWLTQIDEGAVKTAAYATALQTAFVTVEQKKEDKKPE